MKKIGRYDIIEELGRGAMGVVYKASDPTIGRLVAIKLLSLDPSSDVDMSRGLNMFMREARAAGRLSHPGIVTIYDVLEDPETQARYIVMEFVRGRTLEKALAPGQPLDTKRALDIANQIAEALDYAHRQNVIHRDLKPANILLSDADCSKITDFGIAKFTGRVGTILTDGVIGTPSYMSPEQVSGGKVDARSDLFSLGVILYVMLTGQKPFEGDMAAVMFKIAFEDPVLPSQLNPELGPAHDHIVMRCLVKDRKKRYSSAREFLNDLADVRQGQPPRSETKFSISELRARESAVGAEAPAVARPSSPKAEARKKAAVAAVFLFLGALLVWKVWTYRHRNSAKAPPAATQATAPSMQTPPAALATAQSSLGSSVPSASSSSVAPPKGRSVHNLQKASAPAIPAVAGSKVASAAVAPSLRAKPAKARTVASKAARTGKVVHLVCRHELQEATLTISSDTEVIFSADLKGRRKAALLGIKGSYAGTLSRPLTIPPGAQELSVRIVSADRSLDLTNTISATSAAGPSAALYVIINRDGIALSWGVIHPRAP